MSNFWRRAKPFILGALCVTLALYFSPPEPYYWLCSGDTRCRADLGETFFAWPHVHNGGLWNVAGFRQFLWRDCRCYRGATKARISAAAFLLCVAILPDYWRQLVFAVEISLPLADATRRPATSSHARSAFDQCHRKIPSGEQARAAQFARINTGLPPGDSANRHGPLIRASSIRWAANALISKLINCKSERPPVFSIGTLLTTGPKAITRPKCMAGASSASARGRMFTNKASHSKRVKLHRNLADAIVATLTEIFDKNIVAERAIGTVYETHPKWGKRDRAFVAQTVYEIVRWRRLLEFAAQDENNWALLSAQLARTNQELPQWDEFKPYNAAWMRTRLQIPEIERAIAQSIPDWLDELGARELGERWDAEIAALNQSAPVVLRANTLKISRDELRAQLSESGFETTTIAGLPDALQLTERKAVTRNRILQRTDYLKIQDAASQMVAPFAAATAGMKVLDACAGAGGKTLHLAACMENAGELRALDVTASKLDELSRRAARAGADVEVALANEKSLQQLRGLGRPFSSRYAVFGNGNFASSTRFEMAIIARLVGTIARHATRNFDELSRFSRARRRNYLCDVFDFAERESRTNRVVCWRISRMGSARRTHRFDGANRF